jgi:hypothetical protein
MTVLQMATLTGQKQKSERLQEKLDASRRNILKTLQAAARGRDELMRSDSATTFFPKGSQRLGDDTWRWCLRAEVHGANPRAGVVAPGGKLEPGKE